MLACIWQYYRHMAASRNHQTVTVFRRAHKAVSCISGESPLMKHQKMRQETTEIAGRGPGLDLWFYPLGPSSVTVHSCFTTSPQWGQRSWQRSTVGPLGHTATWTYATVQLLIYPSQHQADCAFTAAAHYHSLTYSILGEARQEFRQATAYFHHAEFILSPTPALAQLSHKHLRIIKQTLALHAT